MAAGESISLHFTALILFSMPPHHNPLFPLNAVPRHRRPRYPVGGVALYAH
jgi:hypothetical protein